MRFLRQSSLEEYAKWYLDRQRYKGGDKAESAPIPVRAEQQIATMRTAHCGKMRDWFQESRWHIVELDAVDLSKLVFLESCWTKEKRLVIPNPNEPNYRILRQVAENALKSDYLNHLPHDHPELKKYYEALIRGELQLVGRHRIVVCSAENEITSNPDARYYLLDGTVRCLAYMMLLLEGKVEGRPIEAFLAER